MVGGRDAAYRLKVAVGFLEEMRQDVELSRWRSVVDNAQLAVENAAKAVLALLGPVGRTHSPAIQLRQALREGLFPVALREQITRLSELAETLGFDIHVQTDYGDEMGGRTPWELFDKADARQAQELAEEAVSLAGSVVSALVGPTP
jgi:HEPN domain-containing protein